MCRLGLQERNKNIVVPFFCLPLVCGPAAFPPTRAAALGGDTEGTDTVRSSICAATRRGPGGNVSKRELRTGGVCGEGEPDFSVPAATR
mmetsp:Transcript_9497/g.19355  ORF Transcript_9497/g.19355 Transcript_9497/m.19355 type:complete len:89 (-) Transcript_9497:329-595(-)